jgi:hypothetical protein
MAGTRNCPSSISCELLTRLSNALLIRRSPLNLIRPIVTLIALIVCVITGFFLRHSFQKEGLVGLLISAYYEATAAIWLIVLGEKEKGMARVQKFNDDKDIDMSRWASSA